MLKASLPMPLTLSHPLRDALVYALETEGNAIRPELCFCAGTHLGMEPAKAQNLAIAIELFHLASLIFDDLPSMDNAQMRRQKPCLHQVHGESMSILSALALINRAYALIWGCLLNADPTVASNAGQLVEQQMGLSGLIQGQALDLTAPQNPSPIEAAEIARMKTASLIKLAIALPAQIMNVSAESIEKLLVIGDNWGLMYQTADDLKDRIGDAIALGKDAGCDERLGRSNIAHQQGIEGARMMSETYLKTAGKHIMELVQIDKRWQFLQGFNDLLSQRLQSLLTKVAHV
jgi:geranylgeranyl diphosphate synthase type II